MKTVNVSFKLRVKDEIIDNLTSVINHHMDYLLDLESWPEIESVFDAKMEEVNNATQENI